MIDFANNDIFRLGFFISGITNVLNKALSDYVTMVNEEVVKRFLLDVKEASIIKCRFKNAFATILGKLVDVRTTADSLKDDMIDSMRTYVENIIKDLEKQKE